MEPAIACSPSGEVGILSDDGRTCTTPSGALVTFDLPLVFPLSFDRPNWNFTITRNDQTCLRYVLPDDRVQPVSIPLNDSASTITAAGTVAEKWTSENNDLSVSLTCPDGSSVTTTKVSDLVKTGPRRKVSRRPSMGATKRPHWAPVSEAP